MKKIIIVFILLLVAVFFWRLYLLADSMLRTGDGYTESMEYYKKMDSQLDFHEAFNKKGVSVILYDIGCSATAKTINISFVVDRHCDIPDVIENYVLSHPELSDRRILLKTISPPTETEPAKTYTKKSYFWWRIL